MTMDALGTRHASGRLGFDGDSVTVVDEAGMADTRRLANVVEVASESRAKLVLVGDHAQLSPVGAGGLFGEIGKRANSGTAARLPDRPYDLRAGDEVILTGQLRPSGEERLENGTRGHVLSVDGRERAEEGAGLGPHRQRRARHARSSARPPKDPRPEIYAGILFTKYGQDVP